MKTREQLDRMLNAHITVLDHFMRSPATPELQQLMQQTYIYVTSVVDNTEAAIIHKDTFADDVRIMIALNESELMRYAFGNLAFIDPTFIA